jgi:neutral trehalase
MMRLEQVLAKTYRLKGDPDDAQRYLTLANNRGAAIRRLMWNEQAGFFADYLWQEGRLGALNAKDNFHFERTIGGWRGGCVVDLRRKR